MRKILIAAVAAFASLAVAAVALAQNPPPTASLEVSMAPSKVGTKKKPKSGRLELSATTNRESRSTASQLAIWIPKGAKLSTRGLKSCSWGKLNATGTAGCSKAKAGSGEAFALLNPYAENPSEIQFIVTAFSGGKLNSADAAALRTQFPDSGSLYKKGREVVNFHLSSEAPEVNQALAGVISKVSSPIYGQKLTIDIAPNLQQPAGNVYSSLQSLETSLARKGRKGRHLISLTDCPRARENQFRLDLTFVPNPNPPGATEASAVDGARCSG